ncbi:class II glutamine amidotransferase [Thermococcus sp.]
MCRVLFAVGEGREMKPLLDALVKASENDPYRAARGKEGRHEDGWGYLVFRDGRLEHYRSRKAIFNDLESVQRLRDSLDGFTILLAHSRAASQGSKGMFNVQPFAFSTRRGFSFWLYHNGDLDRKRLIELGEFEESDLEHASDSYILGAYLCRKLRAPKKDELLGKYSGVIPAVTTSLNTGALFLSGDSLLGFVTAYSKPTYLLRRENWEYVRQIVLKGNSLFAVASSTLELYHKADWENAINGTAFYVEIDPEEGRFEVESLIMG